MKNENYTYVERENGRIRMLFNKCGESRVQQHQKDQCDINMIIKKFRRTGKLPLCQQQPIYGDFSNSVDYKKACEIMAVADQQFALLPAELRKRFGNSPEAFLDFCNDPENEKEMIKLGLKIDDTPVIDNPVEEKVNIEGDEVNNASEKETKE